MNVALKMKDLQMQTGVSREAIHFYLREGLLPEPERPKQNVALYRDEHVVRIRLIKQLQKERSLSLAAIKRILTDFDYEALPPGGLSELEVAIEARVNGELPTKSQPLDEVAAKTGLDLDFIHEAGRRGVITIDQQDGGAVIDYRDAGILDQWAKLMRIGFAEKPGYDVHYLERFARAIQVIAEVEVDTFLDAFTELPATESAKLAAEGISITNEIVTRLRTQALMRALHSRVSSNKSTAR